MRVKFVVPRRHRRKKIKKLAKGYYGAQSRATKIATQYVIRALSHSYRGRKKKKRDFRKLWIERINAAARQNGINYSRLMFALKKMGVQINRKMLAELAFSDPLAFESLCKEAKSFIANP
ncbi:MAG: 50S ribosomal protein L20 [Candidatus Calescibacterium sp.]|nr:50S ribosomal protein L20 [Candidatus Calescibacterium sp.]MCX7733832.1 50S ribosomal protein L20 [bacterium]MDW8086613.1 50S ribosomal protein L20 [Candidatus Calescibacterium sp.]